MPGTAGVIFDVDGVLIDSYASHFESWRQLAAEIGRTCTEADFARNFGRTARETMVQQWPDFGWTEEEIQRIDYRKEFLYRQTIAADFPAMAGAVELMRSLHDAGVKIAVGSSAPPENVDLTLQKLGVMPLIQCRITGRDVQRGKPDPQVFQLAARGLDLPVSACCVIEDAPVGIQAAHAAGIVCIGLASTGRTRSDLHAADLVVDTLGELNPETIGIVIQGGLR